MNYIRYVIVLFLVSFLGVLTALVWPHVRPAPSLSSPTLNYSTTLSGRGGSAAPVVHTPPSSTSTGQVYVGTLENTYTNEKFGVSFRFPSTFRLDQAYPYAVPSLDEPSLNGPYSILLYKSPTDKYPVFEIDILPKSAWDEVIALIKQQQYPYYPFPSSASGEPVGLNGALAYSYTGSYSPYLYYFQHPSLPYMITVRPWDLPSNVETLQLFYGLLASFRFRG
jgi:hypothetical protein